MHYNTRVLSDSIKFYLPRTEGYLEIIREPTKYMLVGVHINDIKEEDLISFAKIRIMLKQKSLAFELNNRLILVEES
jgi:hypothetical protein